MALFFAGTQLKERLHLKEVTNKEIPLVLFDRVTEHDKLFDKVGLSD